MLSEFAWLLARLTGAVCTASVVTDNTLAAFDGNK